MDASFADLSATAWTFHRHSSRWTHNVLSPGVDDVPEPGKELVDLPWRALPAPRPPEGSLADALLGRRSARAFAGSMSLEALGDLLHWSYGVVEPSRPAELLRRPVPSGGAMYALELYVLARHVEGLPPGAYHYQPIGHGLEEVRDVAPPHALATYLFMGQACAADAACVVVVTAVFRRSLKKYRDRGYRYLLIEAGHVGQNLGLCAVGLELAACPLGGFFDNELGQLLRLDLARELPLYAVAVGAAAPAF